MKLDQHEVEKDKVEVVKQAEVNKTEVQWSIPNPKKGHTLFEINTETGAISKAEFEEVNVELTKLGKEANLKTIKKKVLIKKYCTYISALNIRNACIKFEKEAKKLM